MKFKFIRDYANQFSVERMAHILQVSRSGYYKYIKNSVSNRENKNLKMIDMIKAIYIYKADELMEALGFMQN